MHATKTAFGLSLLISSMMFCFPQMAALAAAPVHSVHGHGVYRLNPPARIDQVTLNASVDADGVVTGGMALWPSIYLAPPRESAPDFAGWIWKITINTLSVSGNIAYMTGIVTFDNRFPHNVGCVINFTVMDNGSGEQDPPDELQVSGCTFFDNAPIIGGNFTVR